MINIMRWTLKILGFLVKVRAHVRAGGTVPVMAYWRST
jgi:hypothetical protein